MYCGFISSGSRTPITRACYNKYSIQKPISSSIAAIFFCVSVFAFIESYQPISSTSLFSTGLQICFRCWNILNIEIVRIQSARHIFGIYTSLTLTLRCCPPIWQLPNHRELQANSSFSGSYFCPTCLGRLSRYKIDRFCLRGPSRFVFSGTVFFCWLIHVLYP